MNCSELLVSQMNTAPFVLCETGKLAFLLLLCKLPVLPLHKNIHPLIEIREPAAGDYNFLVFGD